MLVQFRPSLRIIHHKNGRPYVRERLRTYEDGVLAMNKKIDHGPFRDNEEASRFLAQRSVWQTGLLNHLKQFGTDQPYRDFVFYENDERSDMQILLDGDTGD